MSLVLIVDASSGSKKKDAAPKADASANPAVGSKAVGSRPVGTGRVGTPAKALAPAAKPPPMKPPPAPKTAPPKVGTQSVAKATPKVGTQSVQLPSFSFGLGGGGSKPLTNLDQVKADIAKNPQQALARYEKEELAARKAWETAKDTAAKAEALKALRLTERNVMLAKDALPRK